MRISKIAATGWLLTAIAVTPVMAMGGRQHACKAGHATEESYTWNFPKEASSILQGVRTDATKVEYQADRLRGLSMNTTVGWRSHSGELNRIRAEVNDLGAKLCRLETIRTAALPWQRQAIERTAVLAKEMATNTTQAINYLNSNHEHLWSPTYRQDTANLYHEGERLAQSIGRWEKLAKLRAREQDVRAELGARAGS